MIQIMESRHGQLEGALEGLKETGIPLVSLSAEGYHSAGYTDDLGIYYFIPKLSQFLGISLDFSIDLFFLFLLLVPFLISTICFFRFFQTKVARGAILCGHLLLATAIFRCSDVYIAPYFALGSILPLFFLNQEPSLKLAPLGLLAGYADHIRSFAGMSAVIFVFLWILLNFKKMRLVLPFFLIFYTLPYFHFHYLQHQRDQFLHKENQSVSITHPKWHSIYIGLGYLPNPYGIQYSDAVAIEKVKSIQPKALYCSPEYEKILKQACLQLIIQDPVFCLKVLFAKALAVLWKALIFINVGIGFLFYVRPSWQIVAPFLVTALFSCSSGLLVMPILPYLTGFVTTVTFFSLYLICQGVKKSNSWQLQKNGDSQDLSRL